MALAQHTRCTLFLYPLMNNISVRDVDRSEDEGTPTAENDASQGNVYQRTFSSNTRQ